jgi:glycolate oxidase FAD binding subunit
VGLLGPGATATGQPPADFADYPFAAGDTGLKLTCTLGGVAALLQSARRVSADHGVAVRVRGSAAGVLYAGLPAGTPGAAAAQAVAALRAEATTYGGSLTVLTAPPEVRDAVDVWGPVPGWELMRRVKQEMDPGHRLAPGRFVGGI